jgi:hypothetical protein
MRSRLALVLGCFLGPFALAVAAASCGDRTGLPLFDGVDASFDAREAPHFTDHFVPPDVPEEDSFDAPEDDALPDVPLMLVPDALVDQCPDAGATLIYVVTYQGQLLSFDPPTLTFTTIGDLICPSGTATPYSMAVNRHGIAYVVYSDGNIFRVSTANAACEKTAYVSQPPPFRQFGMGFVAGLSRADGGAAEAGVTEGGLTVVDRLFVASSQATSTSTMASELGFIDTHSYSLGVVGSFEPVSLYEPELTGTGDGRLYAYYGNENASAFGIAEIDPATAQIVAKWPVDVPHGTAWAFAFWGGVFYLFTSPDTSYSLVHRFDPSDGSTTLVTSTGIGVAIDGAGVSTCAPVR